MKRYEMPCRWWWRTGPQVGATPPCERDFEVIRDSPAWNVFYVDASAPPNDFELRPGFSAGDYLKDVLSKAGTYNVGQ